MWFLKYMDWTTFEMPASTRGFRVTELLLTATKKISEPSSNPWHSLTAERLHFVRSSILAAKTEINSEETWRGQTLLCATNRV